MRLTVLFALLIIPLLRCSVFDILPTDPGPNASFDDKLSYFAKSYLHTAPRAAMVVATLRGDSVRYYSFGAIDPVIGKVPDSSTIFEIGSISKTFTSLLASLVTSEHSISMQMPIDSFLPAHVKAPYYNTVPITLQNLSTHSSGLPGIPYNLDVLSLEIDRNDPYANYDTLKAYDFLNTFSLPRAPGTQWEYSNYGAALLATIIGRISGSTYESLLQSRICDVLGLQDTRVHLNSEQEKRFCLGYIENGKPMVHWSFEFFEGAGAIRSTAVDMVKYLRANMPGTLSPLRKAIDSVHTLRYTDSVLKMNTQAIVPSSINSFMGLGWIATLTDNDTIDWHNGGTSGFLTFAGFYRQANVGAIVLCNSARDVTPIAFDILYELKNEQ